MSWIETIRIRLGRGNQGEEGMRLLEMMESDEKPLNMRQWEIYMNPAVKEELMMVLHWGENLSTLQGSGFALALIQELKKQGLVEHTVWEDARLGIR